MNLARRAPMSMRATLALCLSALSLFACGGATTLPGDPSPPPDPTEPIPAPPPPATSGAKPTPAPSPPPSPVGTPVGAIDLTLHNTSGHDVWVVVDSQATPLWLEIDQPALPLNGYGGSWCGDASGTHNDPVWRAAKIPAGDRSKTSWPGTYVSREAGCWQRVYVPAGAHDARVCVYDSDPGSLLSTKGTMSGAPSGWFQPEPSRCLEVVLSVPAQGAAGLTVEL